MSEKQKLFIKLLAAFGVGFIWFIIIWLIGLIISNDMHYMSEIRAWASYFLLSTLGFVVAVTRDEK